MRHRTVGELMTSGVVRAHPDTPFKEFAQLLERNDVTAVPVVDEEDRPLGVVSEADLLRHAAAGEDPAGLLPPARLSPRERARSEALTGQGLMSSPAVCARPEWTVVEAARLMEGKRLKRLPVVDEAGRLIGIVSRSDLLRVFLRSDRAIHEEIRHEVLDGTLGLYPDSVDVQVHEGQVTLSGVLERHSQQQALVRLCRGVDGVVAVHDRLGYRADDTTGQPVGPAGRR
ncbi:CBS domain-containing protein [Streptacidiphilus sp. ASG 303]|uniref:CBS domain-containing protein n=1 Tax=Streptacidiphilus sp. ASG 303 TaxID=2896847 RepID=UPI001E47AD5F|nr:CBS domain-containing protein [Streptacidiphilus sp. ASG 303]MCD0484498.1 CBS domain-containing protein [Streptacidiphilus sp. ASG 303]